MAGLLSSPSFGTPTNSPIGGGFQFRNQFSPANPSQGPVSPSSALTNQYKLYDSAVGQNAQSYDDIMGGYKNLSGSATPLAAKSFNPQSYSFSPTSDYKGAVSNLQELSKTGGYSDTDIANLRARGISPIHAVYANAQNNISRQKSLQGGYSPNYTAATAKLTRNESQDVSSGTQNVNAGIAQAQAQNKLSIAPTLANVTGQESALENSYGARAADVNNEGQKFNISNEQDISKYNEGNDLQRRLAALEGMRSLYGTTPAMSALFGDQALRSANLVQNDVNNQVNTGTGLSRLIASGMR